MHGSVHEHRVSPGEALPGVTIHALVDGDRPLFAFFLIKVMASDGPRWGVRCGGQGASDVELYGALDVQAELLRQKIVGDWFIDEDDDDEDDEDEAGGGSVAAGTELRLALDDVLGVLDIEPLASDGVVEFVFVLVKTLGDYGTNWSFRTSAAPVREELLGALVAEMERRRGLLAASDAEI